MYHQRRVVRRLESSLSLEAASTIIAKRQWPRRPAPPIKPVTPLKTLDGSRFCENTDERQATVTCFFQQLLKEDTSEIPAWIYRRWDACALEKLELVSEELLRTLLVTFKRGKTCADDSLVAEMLMSLDEESLQCVAEAFSLKLLNEDDEATWDHHIVNLVATSFTEAINVDVYRPIAVIQVFYKLCSKTLDFLSKPLLRPLLNCQFAFRKGYQCDDVVFIIRNLIEKACEYVIDGDIAKAYDNTSHHVAIAGLRAAGCPMIIVGAYFRELRKLQSTFVLDKRTRSKPVSRRSSLLEGDSWAPTVFNYALELPLRK